MHWAVLDEDSRTLNIKGNYFLKAPKYEQMVPEKKKKVGKSEPQSFSLTSYHLQKKYSK